MRLRSDLWVKAYIRAIASHGDFATVVHRGDAEHGVVYIKLNKLDGTSALYGPAPPSLTRDADEGEGERIFALQHAAPVLPERDIDQRAARNREFDPDIWIVETESRKGRHGLDDWLATPS